MARLLSLLLLHQAGYEVGRYISLEGMIEKTKEGYYESLHASSQGWHEAQHSLVPWWEYFVGVMLVTAYREFEDRVGVTTARRGACARAGFRLPRGSTHVPDRTPTVRPDSGTPVPTARP